jgi:hypothetical protein
VTVEGAQGTGQPNCLFVVPGERGQRQVSGSLPQGCNAAGAAQTLLAIIRDAGASVERPSGTTDRAARGRP